MTPCQWHQFIIPSLVPWCHSRVHIPFNHETVLNKFLPGVPEMPLIFPKYPDLRAVPTVVCKDKGYAKFFIILFNFRCNYVRVFHHLHGLSVLQHQLPH